MRNHMVVQLFARAACSAVAAVVLLAATPLFVAAQTETGSATLQAKGVYEARDRTGARFNVLLVRDGRERRVSADYDFRSGDRMKFEVETNRPAFVYVLNRTLRGDARRLQSKGIDQIREEDLRARGGNRVQYTLLYPGKGERPIALPPNRPVRLPQGRGNLFVMDNEPGIEKLYVVLSERPIDIGDHFNLETGRQRSGRAASGRGTDEDVLDQLNTAMASWSGNGTTAIAPKGIDTVDSYALAHEAGGPYLIEVDLKHLR